MTQNTQNLIKLDTTNRCRKTQVAVKNVSSLILSSNIILKSFINSLQWENRCRVSSGEF